MARLGGRAYTWLLYVPATVASTLFAIVSLVTFGDLAQIQFDESVGSPGSQLNGSMAATFMAPVLTAGLILMSFFVLVKKSWSRSGAGFSYGYCSSWFVIQSMFQLLTGVVLTGNKHYTSYWESSPKGIWTRSATNAFVATYVLAFISAAGNLVMGATMISNRKSFGGAQLTVDELGLSDRLRASGTPRSDATAGSPAPPYTTNVPGTRSMPAVGGASNGAWSTV